MLRLTGPLLEENMGVVDIPQKQRTELAVHLCGKYTLSVAIGRLNFTRMIHPI